jgi:hypothetical protein
LFALGLMLVVAACGDTETNGGSSGDATPQPESGTIVAPLQIQTLDVLIAESFPPMVSVRVVAIIPDSCTTAREPEVSRQGKQITVRLLGERPAGRMCAQVIREQEQSIPLGTFDPGDYSLTVNDKSTTFKI